VGDCTRGTGLLGLRDRVEALGGRVTLDSPRGLGTTLMAEFPLTDSWPSYGGTDPSTYDPQNPQMRD
jgi:signal transduction histidine kinase